MKTSRFNWQKETLKHVSEEPYNCAHIINHLLLEEYNKGEGSCDILIVNLIYRICEYLATCMYDAGKAQQKYKDAFEMISLEEELKKLQKKIKGENNDTNDI